VRLVIMVMGRARTERVKIVYVRRMCEVGWRENWRV
jgi:hypothetical protein